MTDSPVSQPAAAARATTFKYIRPEFSDGKKIVTLARTRHLIGAVQVIKRGGENNLHAHKHLDGFWMVMSGRARFYGAEDVVLGELGKHEGILVPRGVPYWFESVGDEDLELFQVEASDVPLVRKEDLVDDRIDYTSMKRAIDVESFENAARGD